MSLENQASSRRGDILKTKGNKKGSTKESSSNSAERP